MNEYWHQELNRRVESAKVDAFLADIAAVYAKHGMSLGHEDDQGSFIVEPMSALNVKWLMAASITVEP